MRVILKRRRLDEGGEGEEGGTWGGGVVGLKEKGGVREGTGSGGEGEGGGTAASKGIIILRITLKDLSTSL